MYDRGQIMTEEERIELINFACSIYYKCSNIGYERLDYELNRNDLFTK